MSLFTFPQCILNLFAVGEFTRDLNLLVNRVSAGRVVPLVAHLIRENDLDPQEIVELKKLIAAAEEKQKSKSR